MNQNDLFAEFRPRQSAKVTTNEQPKQEDAFSEFRPKQDSWTDKAKRLGAQTIARPIEAIGTIPGNLLRFISDYGITAGEKLSGKDLSGARNALEDTAAFKLLPTSEQGKKISSKATGGLTYPKSHDEEVYGEVLDLGTILATAGENPSSWSNLAKKFGLAIGVKGAKEGAKTLGVGETGQAATELGSLALGSMYRPRAIQEYLGKQFQNLRTSPIAQRIIPTDSLEKSLDKLESSLKYGGTGPSARAAFPKLEELKQIAKKGHVPVDEVLTAYQKVGEEISAKNLYDQLGKEGSKKLRHNLDQMKESIGETLKQYTPKEFYEDWKSINQGYSTYAQSRRVADWVNRNKYLILKSVAPGVIGDLYLSVGATGPAVAGAAGAFAVKEIGEVVARISRSPSLRKYYLESLEQISKENTTAAIASIQRLQKAMDEEDKKK